MSNSPGGTPRNDREGEIALVHLALSHDRGAQENAVKTLMDRYEQAVVAAIWRSQASQGIEDGHPDDVLDELSRTFVTALRDFDPVTYTQQRPFLACWVAVVRRRDVPDEEPLSDDQVSFVRRNWTQFRQFIEEKWLPIDEIVVGHAVMACAGKEYPHWDRLAAGLPPLWFPGILTLDASTGLPQEPQLILSRLRRFLEARRGIDLGITICRGELGEAEIEQCHEWLVSNLKADYPARVTIFMGDPGTEPSLSVSVVGSSRFSAEDLANRVNRIVKGFQEHLKTSGEDDE